MRTYLRELASTYVEIFTVAGRYFAPIRWYMDVARRAEDLRLHA